MLEHPFGPWHIVESESEHMGMARIHIKHHGVTVAALNMAHYPTAMANAKFIVTAPEMLDFIEKLSDIPVIDIEDTASEATLDWIEKEARALIAKAKGEPND